ncbi:MAG: hypothetical protein A2172_00970 [Candidatus Woykebacteria bacterium RBG_13_40_15]|uniref:Uncharacterized protein n=1 Tax=Candidatus Woykebacteria bacterium RBG_13_40_15 TaxID=1802593 RepID=A0A1G1W8V4_9BACT|nr:MAG: hypothetical protein A2172_00970 [Candidatus Woykebacteria bacterium RBG_13_40_15]
MNNVSSWSVVKEGEMSTLEAQLMDATFDWRHRILHHRDGTCGASARDLETGSLYCPAEASRAPPDRIIKEAGREYTEPLPCLTRILVRLARLDAEARIFATGFLSFCENAGVPKVAAEAIWEAAVQQTEDYLARSKSLDELNAE